MPCGVPCGARPRWVPGAIPSNWCHPHPFQLWLPDDYWAQASLSLGLQDPDSGDHGPFCFSILVGHGGNHVFGVELGSELATWELSFQRATFRAVQRTRVSGLLVSERPESEPAWRSFRESRVCRSRADPAQVLGSSVLGAAVGGHGGKRGGAFSSGSPQCSA